MGVRLQVLRVVDVEEQRLDEVAGARPAHLAAVLPAALLGQQGEVERGVELGHVLGVEHVAALHVTLAGDLQAVQVALAVAHDLVRAVAFLVRVRGLPVAGVHVLGLEPHGAAEGEVGLEHVAGLADRTLVTHEARRGRRSRAEAAIEEGVFGREHADGLRVEGAGPVVVQDVPKRLKRGRVARKAGHRGWASP